MYTKCTTPVLFGWIITPKINGAYRRSGWLGCILIAFPGVSHWKGKEIPVRQYTFLSLSDILDRKQLQFDLDGTFAACSPTSALVSVTQVWKTLAIHYIITWLTLLDSVHRHKRIETFLKTEPDCMVTVARLMYPAKMFHLKKLVGVETIYTVYYRSSSHSSSCFCLGSPEIN